MNTSVPTDTQGDAMCPEPSGATRPVAARHTQLFPPRDADAEARRRWLASSPWPEVVFASAGSR